MSMYRVFRSEWYEIKLRKLDHMNKKGFLILSKH